jgi:hypothetical protein
MVSPLFSNHGFKIKRLLLHPRSIKEELPCETLDKNHSFSPLLPSFQPVAASPSPQLTSLAPMAWDRPAASSTPLPPKHALTEVAPCARRRDGRVAAHARRGVLGWLWLRSAIVVWGCGQIRRRPWLRGQICGRPWRRRPWLQGH